LKEGRNREVRRLWEAVGHTVSRLSRIRYGNIELGRQLKSGQTVDIQQVELKKLYELAGLTLPDTMVKKKKSMYRNKGQQKKSTSKSKWRKPS
jgi:23S rRNA pseudouridine2605 synthase